MFLYYHLHRLYTTIKFFKLELNLCLYKLFYNLYYPYYIGIFFIYMHCITLLISLKLIGSYVHWTYNNQSKFSFVHITQRAQETSKSPKYNLSQYYKTTFPVKYHTSAEIHALAASQIKNLIQV